ncbi:MAG: trypsin-like serine protease [Chloroflexi bacterium]|nr:trypsin-like serine protease [Chloroflexota bacterium]
MTTLRTAAIIGLCTLIALTSFFATTYAITGNYQPSSTPYVGIVVLFSDAARTQPISYSTGVLISPTVVLTAGHSVTGGVAASVCFDQGPIPYTVDASGKISYGTNQPVYNGVPIPYPAYTASVEAGAKASKVLQTSDVGLIILDTPVQEVTSFPTLPPAGLADTLPVKTDLQVIGYGVQYQTTPRGHDVNTWMGTLSRNSATVQLLSTNFQGSSNYLMCTANAAQGKGGVAYGDSGGPVLYTDNGQSVVLAVNAYVNNANCAGVTYHTRIDNPQVLDWINGYL